MMGAVCALVTALSLQLVSAHLRPRQAYGGYNSTVIGPPITAPPTGVPTRPIPTGSLSYSNASNAFNGSLAQAKQNTCCFIVYDTYSANYWAHYSTTTWMGRRRLLSTVTAVTEYVDTTITNYETTTTYTTAPYVTSWQIGADNVPVGGFSQGPYAGGSMLNGTITTTDGKVIASPTGFWVFPTVRVLNVPAVTQANGELACATTSVYDLSCPHGSTTAIIAEGTFTGLNSYVQDYYSGQQAHSVVTQGTHNTITLTDIPATNTSAYPSTTVISFSTPYVYFPPAGKTETLYTGDVVQIDEAPLPSGVTLVTPTPTITSTITIELTSTEYTTMHVNHSVPTPTATIASQSVDTYLNDYGFLPTEVITWMLNSPDYATQIPGLESCLPGGPGPIPNVYCASVAADSAEAVPDLTTGAATTVKGVGCFHPGNCPQATAVGAAQALGDNSPTQAATQGSSVAVAPVAETQAPPIASNVGNNPLSAIAPMPVIPTSKASPVEAPSSKQPQDQSPKAVPALQPSSQAENSAPAQASSPSPKVIPAPQPSGQAENSAPAQASSPSPKVVPTPQLSGQAENSAPVQAQSPSPKIVPAPQPSGQAENSADAGNPVQNPSPSNSAVKPVVPVAGETTASANAQGSSPESNPPAANAPKTPNPPAIVIASSTIVQDSSSNFVFGTHTIAPGGNPVVISSSTISLAPSASALIVNGATSIIQPPTPHPSSSGLGAIIAGAFTGHATITEGGQAITANSASEFVIGSQTIAPGAPAVTVSGSTFSLAPEASAIVVNGQTSALYVTPKPTAAGPILTINSSPVAPNSASAYVVSDQTLAPGSSAITVAGTTYSLPSSASSIIINGTPSPLPFSPADTIAPVLTIGSQPITANSASTYTLSGQTLAPGSHPITVAGTTYSLAPSASALIINGQTSQLSSPGAPVFTINSTPITASLTSISQLLLGSQTILPGAPPITINNTPVSLAPGGSTIVVGSTTEPLSGTAPVITLGSSTLTGRPTVGTEYVVSGQTLVPGASGIVINGESVSLEASATAVVVGGSTEAFSATGYAGPAFTASASRLGTGLWGQMLVFGLGIGVLLMM